MAHNYTPARDAIVVAGDEWNDDNVTDLTYDGDLDPGDEETVAVVRSTKRNVKFAPRAVATTVHPGDIDGDGNDENIVEYHFDHKQSITDEWNELPGMTTTMPFGSIGQPVELIPGTFIGPVAAFRIRFVNRSDTFSTPLSAAEDDIGGEIHGRTVRGSELEAVRNNAHLKNGGSK
jgi:hypothetical protein